MHNEAPIQRRKSKRIYVGNVPIGDGAPIAVQSMTNTRTTDVEATVNQIKALERVGADDAPVLMPVGVEESDGGEQLVSHHAALVLVSVPFRGSLRLVRRVERVACDLDGAEGVREVEREVLPWAAGVDRVF